MVKVLHIAEASGGVQRYLTQLVLITDKLDQVLVAPYANSVNAEAKVIQFSFNRNVKLMEFLSSVTSLRKIIRDQKPDIVYCHSSFAGVYGRLAAIGLPNEVVYNPHGWAFDMKISPFKKYVYIWIERILALVSKRIILISQHEQNLALKYHIAPSRKLSLIENAVNLQEIDSLKQEEVPDAFKKFVKNRFVIGMNGRLDMQKSPDVFVEVAKRLHDVCNNFVFVIVGDGPDREQVEETITREGLSSSFYITGWVNEPLKFVSYFDVGVLLSRWEGFGLAVLEYMALGIPVVGSTAGNIPKLIHDSNAGIIVSIKDREAISSAIDQLSQDKEKRSELGKRGMNFVKVKMSQSRFQRDYLQMINSLVAHD